MIVGFGSRFAFSVGACLICSVICSKASTDVTAVTRERVHPVLIGKPHNPVMLITVSVSEKSVSLKSLSFDLHEASSRDDVAQFELFVAGKDGSFATNQSFGGPTSSDGPLVFKGDLPLKVGEHQLWLSCALKDSADLSHHLDVTCTAIETTEGRIEPTDDTPGISHRTGVALRQHNDDGVDTYRIPALATTNDGTLLCAYDMRRRKSRDLQEDIDIGLSRSTDGGQTWESPRVIMDMGTYGGLPQSQNGCSDPGLLVDRETGDIFCFSVWMWGKPEHHQWRGIGSEPGYIIGESAQFMMVKSNDDGRTWSHPVNLTRQLKREDWWLFAPAPQQGITLRDGTLVMPTQGRDAEGVSFSNIMWSRDHGETWHVSEPATVDTSECQAVELSDGSIMLNCRNKRGVQFRAVKVTNDLGHTWSEHPTHEKALIEPTCNGSLLRFEMSSQSKMTHVLLFANPHATDGRHHQTVQVSFDDGLTWPEAHHLLLDDGRGRGYPSLTQVDDKHVGIVYEGSQADVIFERIPSSELLNE